MVISVVNFGETLMSRPAGKEAFLMAKAYVFKGIKQNETIVLDFDGIKVLAPSWVDEFISGLKSEYSNDIQYTNTDNPSVQASLKTVLEP